MKDGYLFNFDPKKHITSKQDAERLKAVKSQFCEGIEFKVLNGVIHIIKC